MFAVSVIISSLVGLSCLRRIRIGRDFEGKRPADRRIGANFYRWYLAHQVEGKTAKQVQDFWDTAILMEWRLLMKRSISIREGQLSGNIAWK